MAARVSIMIPFKTVDAEVRKCIAEILKMDFEDFEIILLPDAPLEEQFPKSRVVVTGPVVPALKRNKAIFSAESEFLASIDSDAYPAKDWLSEALPLFEDETVCAVGGPNLIPPEASVLEKAAHDITYSRLGLATAYHKKKYKPGLSEAKELASSNLILRRSDVLKTKGYNTTRLTGEDSVLCFDLTRATGKKIISSPRVRVYHSRHRLFGPHLRKTFLQAKDKVRVLLTPFELRNIIYFVPALFVLYLVAGILLSFVSPWIFRVFVVSLAAYFLLVVFDSLRSRSVLRTLLFLVGLPLTHIAYGLGYIWGVCRQEPAKNT